MAHPIAADVFRRDVSADGDGVPMVLLSRSRLAERMEALRAAGQRLCPDEFFRASAKAVEKATSGEL